MNDDLCCLFSYVFLCFASKALIITDYFFEEYAEWGKATLIIIDYVMVG